MFESFLGKEWLVKTDSSSSTPYLFKFISSTIDLTCSVLFTDTKSIWSEELTSQQIARRWRKCNPRAPPPFAIREDEDEWRASILELLRKVHTIGGVDTLAFEVVLTDYSDIAFLLKSASFTWQWETCFVGHKISADIISQQLVSPLISTNYLLFTTAESVQDMTNTDVEKAIDKIGRTTRRSVDTHIQNAFSNPRISTILRRATAVFNSLHELPGIQYSAEDLDLEIPKSSKLTEDDSTSSKYEHDSQSIRDMKIESKSPLSKVDSATEKSEEDDAVGPLVPPTISSQPQAVYSRPLVSPGSLPNDLKTGSDIKSKSLLAKTSDQTPAPARTSEQSDSSSFPKKLQASSSDSDSEAERRARIARLKGNARESGTREGITNRSVRQPIKRGGKRF